MSNLDYSICTLCGRNCGIDRRVQLSFCKSGAEVKIARYGLHKYEEPPISGKNGSGTVFFTGCPLSCVFCQNSKISREYCGKKLSAGKLSDIFLQLKDMGAHNINLVNPTHFAPSIIEAVKLSNIDIPIIWNSHGYDSEDTVKALDGIIDIYLPDIKYTDVDYSQKYSGAKNYFEVSVKAVKLMCTQVKNQFDENGHMKKGVIIRHLILPQMSSDSIKVLEFIKNELPEGTLVSLMAQYTPMNDLSHFPEIDRKITRREYGRVIDKMLQLGLNGYYQDISSSDEMYIPEWNLL